MKYKDFFKETICAVKPAKVIDPSGPNSIQPSADAVVEPDASSVKKQTEPSTVYTPTDNHASCGCEPTQSKLSDNGPTNVEKPPTDPTGTDHITGGMGSTPVNPNIMTKSKTTIEPMTGAGVNAGVVPTAKDISIDIVEARKNFEKSMRDAVKTEKRWTVKF
jgi:hypothetical protein